MILDVCVVVFRPNLEQLSRTLEALSKVTDEFRSLRLLVSGDDLDAQDVCMITESGKCAEIDVRILHRYDNLGFAAGQNLLLKQSFDSGADAALVFNPDLVVECGAIRSLAEWGERNPGSLIGPILISQSPSGADFEIDSLGIEWTSTGRHFDIAAGRRYIPSGESLSQEVAGLTGACLFVPSFCYRTITERSGEFFDESFIAYREDADLGLRARALGIRCLNVPVAGFFHERGVKKASRSNMLVNKLSVQNRFLMRSKFGFHYPGVFPMVVVRDVMVLFACITVERTSLEGVQSAWRIRRFARSKRPSRAVQSLSNRSVSQLRPRR